MTSATPGGRTLVAQISDPHIRRPGELAYGIVDTAAALRRCVTFLNELASRPDIVVVSGDLVDFGKLEEYEHFRSLMAPLAVRYVVLPGNHDERNAMRRAFPDQCFPAEGPLNARVFANDLHILLLDSTVPARPHGILSDETLRWLDAELREHSARPTLIFLHHPPFLTGIRHMDVQNLRNAAALARVLQGHQQVRLLAAGHVHRIVLALFEGVPAVIAPGTSHAVAFDLDPRGPPAFQIETPGLYLHAWTASAEGGQLISHALSIGEHNGPHPFFDTGGNLL
jgi:3',5'-cyclic-AMP phosphodiesterase